MQRRLFHFTASLLISLVCVFFFYSKAAQNRENIYNYRKMKLYLQLIHKMMLQRNYILLNEMARCLLFFTLHLRVPNAIGRLPQNTRRKNVGKKSMAIDR